MKYTVKNLKEAQCVAGVNIVLEGGEVSDAEAKAVAADPWGKRLVELGKLSFEKAVEVPTKPKLGMSVKGTIKGTNSEKTSVSTAAKKSEN